jgi:hypothetical protein
MTTAREPWFTIRELDLCGQAAHAQAMRLHRGQGEERRGMAQDALEVYFGNRRHVVAGAASSVNALVDGLGLATMSPQAQNVIQMIVDTMVSHTIRNKVKPFFLTDGGDTEQRERAKGMMRLTEGVLADAGIYGTLGKLICKSGFMWDGGFCDVIPDYTRGKITLEQMYPWERLAPEEEGPFPRQEHRIRTVDRHMLLQDFGFDDGEDDDGNPTRRKNDLYEQIATAPAAPREMLPESYDGGGIADRVCVIESIHLPSGKVDIEDPKSFGLNEEGELDDSVDPGHDGLRMVQVDQLVLHREPWPYDWFRWAAFLPVQNPTDAWSRGVPETLAAAQIYVNNTRARIARIIHLNSVARLLVWSKAKINKSKFTNDFVSILETQQPPAQSAMYLQGTAPPAELFNEVDRTIEWMKGQYGLNEMSLMGEKPPGVDHAPGMEHLLDEQNLKHSEKFESWENFVAVQLGKRIVEACRMLAMRDPDFEVMCGDDKELVRIKWKDVELERTKFTVRPQKANMLPTTPGMKMKRLSELMNAAPPEFQAQAFASLAEEYPDIGAIVGPANAERKNIERRLDEIARHGVTENTTPHPYLSLDLAKLLTKQKINEAESLGDDDAMENLIKFWEAVDTLQKRLAAEAVPPAPAAGGVAAPVSPPPGAIPPPPGAPGMLQ